MRTVPAAGSCAAPGTGTRRVREAVTSAAFALTLYLATALALAWSCWWWWWNGGEIAGRLAGNNDQGDMTFFVTPLLLGLAAVAALLVPLFRREHGPAVLSVPVPDDEHSALRAHVRQIARAVDAPEPRHVELAMASSTWAGDARWLGRLGERGFTLVIGAPLVECTNVAALTGHIAASLGSYSGLRSARAYRWTTIVGDILGPKDSTEEIDETEEPPPLWRRMSKSFARLVLRGILSLTRFGDDPLERMMEENADACARCVVGDDVVNALADDIERAEDAWASAHEELFTLWLMCELDPGIDLISPIGTVARDPGRRETDPVLGAPASRLVDDWRDMCVKLSEAYVLAEFGRWKADEPRD